MELKAKEWSHRWSGTHRKRMHARARACTHVSSQESPEEKALFIQGAQQLSQANKCPVPSFCTPMQDNKEALTHPPRSPLPIVAFFKTKKHNSDTGRSTAKLNSAHEPPRWQHISQRLRRLLPLLWTQGLGTARQKDSPGPAPRQPLRQAPDGRGASHVIKTPTSGNPDGAKPSGFLCLTSTTTRR